MSLINRLSSAYKSFVYSGVDNVPYYRDSAGNIVMNTDLELFSNNLFTGSDNLKDYYFKVPFLADCVNIYADFASQVQIYEEDSDGNIIEDSPFIEMLKKPNPFQDFQSYIKEAIINTITTGIFINYGTFFERGDLKTDSQIYNLELSNLTFPQLRNSYLLREKDISKLRVRESLPTGEQRDYFMSELGFFYDLGNKGNLDNKSFFNPISRLKSAEVSIQNIIKTEETINYLAGNKVFGVLSKKGNSLVPLGAKEKEDIEQKINFKKKGIVATNEDLQYLSLLIDSKKLQLVEFQNQSKENLRSVLNIPRDILDASSGDTKGSTFENQQFAESRFINGNVKGYTDQILGVLQQKAYRYFEQRGTTLKGSYEHMPSQVAINEKLGNDALNNKLTALDKFFTAYRNGLENGLKIDAKQFLLEHGFEGINLQEVPIEITTQNQQ
jgi:hypothetical protein